MNKKWSDIFAMC